MKREFDVFEWNGDDWKPKRVTVQLPDRVYLSVIDPESYPDRRDISDEEDWRVWWNYDPEPDDIEYVPREELDAANERAAAAERKLAICMATDHAVFYHLWKVRAEEAEARVAELEAAQTWRPVTEKPPTDGYYQTATLTPPVIDHAHYSTDGNWYYRYAPVDFWRPVPPPPDAN